MSDFQIEPKSRKDLRQLALEIRTAFGLKDCLYFPIVEFMERMELIFPNFNWEIIPDDELPSKYDAVTIIENGFGTIQIKQTVYDGACEGNGQHRMTIAHEIIGHFIPMCVMGFRFYRRLGNEEIKTYCDPEWQAKCLAAELLMPFHLVSKFKPKELVEKCGVSKSAAKYQRKIYKKEVENNELIK